MATWEGREKIADAMRTMKPDGYWAGVEPSVQGVRIEDFERAIYPLWKGVAERDRVIEDALSISEVSARGQVMFETSTTHRQDIAIYESGIKPNGEIVPTENLRKKAAASDKFSGWNR